MAVVFGLHMFAPRIPGALVLVVGGLLASWLLQLGDRGVALVGAVPRGLPRFEVPDGELLWDHVVIVAMAAFALMLIGFSQTAGDARAFAVKHHYQIDINQESVAQALANTGAGLFQGMPVSTSLSASSLNDHSGAKTGLASMTSGLTVLLTLLLLAPLFSDLPKAVLAAVIIEAVVMGMMNVPEMRRLARVQRFDFWIAMTAIAATLVFGVLAGVMIGIALSLLWLIAVTTRPMSRCLGASQAHRSTGTSPTTPTTSSHLALPLSGSTVTSSSPRPTLWRTVSATSSTHRAGSTRSCSTARASTLSTPRVRPRWRRSPDPGVRAHPQACPGQASGCSDLGPRWSAGANWVRPHPRQCLPSRAGAKGCDGRQGRPGADLTPGTPAPFIAMMWPVGHDHRRHEAQQQEPEIHGFRPRTPSRLFGGAQLSPRLGDADLAVVSSVATKEAAMTTPNPPIPAAFTNDDFAARMRRVVSAAVEKGLAGVIVTPGPDLVWLIGYRPTAITERLTMLVLSDDNEPTLLVPSSSGRTPRLPRVRAASQLWIGKTAPTLMRSPDHCSDQMESSVFLILPGRCICSVCNECCRSRAIDRLPRVCR